MSTSKLINMIDPARARLVFEMLNRDIINVSLAQVVERCVHYATVTPVETKGKKAKRYGINLTAPDGKQFETIRVTPALLATAFSETYRNCRGPMACNSPNDFLFYLHGVNIVDTHQTRYTLAVDGNKFVLHTQALPLQALKHKEVNTTELSTLPKPVRNAEGELSPSSLEARAKVWNSKLEEAGEPLAALTKAGTLRAPRLVANITKAVVTFVGPKADRFTLSHTSQQGAVNSVGGHVYPLTAHGIANAMHALRIKCPMPAHRVEAKKADKVAKPDSKAAPKKEKAKSAPKKEKAKKVAEVAKPDSKAAPKKEKAKQKPVDQTAPQPTAAATDKAPAAE